MKNKIVLTLAMIALTAVTFFCHAQQAQKPPQAQDEPFTLNPDEVRKLVTSSLSESGDENAETAIQRYIMKMQETSDPSEQGTMVQDLYDDCLAYGLYPAPDIAEVFLALAIKAREKNDTDGFQRYLNFGLTFDPTNPALHQALATVAKENKGLLSMEYLYQSLAGWLYSFTNFTSRFVSLTNLALWFRTLSLLLLAFISLILFMRYNKLARHDVEEWLSVDDERVRKAAGWLLVLLPSVILLSGYWLVVYWAALFLIYCRVPEKVVTIVAVALLLVSGSLSLHMQQELFLSMYPPHFSNLRCYANRVDIGPDQILNQHMDPNDPLQDTYAFVMANRYLIHRSYVKAEKIYTSLLRQKGSDPYVSNNLGCLYFYENRVSDAVAQWSKAIEAKPDLAVAYLNRSLGKNKQFDFDGAREDQSRAAGIDPEQYQKFTNTQQDELIPLPYYPSIVSTRQMALDQFKLFNKSLTGPLKPSNSKYSVFLRPAFSLGMIVFFLAAAFFMITKKREKFARACLKCGRPFCSQCKTSLEFESFCGQCVHLYIKQDGVSPQARMQKNYEVEVFAKRGKVIRTVLSLLAPGAGHLWDGHVFSGFAILFLWLAFLSGFISRIFAYPMPYNLAAGSSGSAFDILGTLFLVLLWLLFGLPKALSRQPVGFMMMRR
ncbi:MAG TPA: tetratricopeptide repeat protein [Acidobacteriota bacterium]|nr:tetratricopeptide repeat protein [Acidobacteriota bacterium]HNT17710.1 tetratricopeptide repeat protein [Acidobacteriota bacterium]HPA27394.1 tetratricopeptide repeat protein [Acidobacteriota bacterium]HQO20146.1 tetratricopeptide repeat protein [Acidobacteriota bacterium]HQQ47148.1 tetratricopeptide repeat protein [Acidobacteriota bacterium]